MLAQFQVFFSNFIGLTFLSGQGVEKEKKRFDSAFLPKNWSGRSGNPKHRYFFFWPYNRDHADLLNKNSKCNKNVKHIFIRPKKKLPVFRVTRPTRPIFWQKCRVKSFFFHFSIPLSGKKVMIF